MKRAAQNGVGQRRIKGKYLLVCIVGNDNKRRRLLSFLLPNGGKKERKWSGRDVNMNHTMYIFPERVKFSFLFSFTWRGKDDRNFFIKGRLAIRIKQREKANNKNGQNPALCRTSSSGFYIQAYTLGDLV